MTFESKKKALLRRIDKFNADLAEFTKANGSCELPSIDSTLISIDPAKPYEYHTTKAGVLIVRDTDNNSYAIEYEGDLYDPYGIDTSLKYDRRRLNKAWRIFKSENPDWELEHDTDDEQ